MPLRGCDWASKCSFVRAGRVHFVSGSAHAQFWRLRPFLGVSIFTVSSPKKINRWFVSQKIWEKTQISDTAVGRCQNLFNSERPVTHAKIASSRASSHLPPNKWYVVRPATEAQQTDPEMGVPFLSHILPASSFPLHEHPKNKPRLRSPVERCIHNWSFHHIIALGFCMKAYRNCQNTPVMC